MENEILFQCESVALRTYSVLNTPAESSVLELRLASSMVSRFVACSIQSTSSRNREGPSCNQQEMPSATFRRTPPRAVVPRQQPCTKKTSLSWTLHLAHNLPDTRHTPVGPNRGSWLRCVNISDVQFRFKCPRAILALSCPMS